MQGIPKTSLTPCDNLMLIFISKIFPFCMSCVNFTYPAGVTHREAENVAVN